MANTKNKLSVKDTINAPVEKVWKHWSEPDHIKQWAFASPDWHAPEATNDLRVGGKFSTTMAAKDGSFSFDFGGVYTRVEENKLAEYELGDGRKVEVTFTPSGSTTIITETFDAEDQNPLDMQQAGWQAILNNMKSYIESR